MCREVLPTNGCLPRPDRLLRQALVRHLDGVIFLFSKKLLVSMVLDQRNDGTKYQDETEQLRVSNIHAHHLPRPVSENVRGEEDNRPP